MDVRSLYEENKDFKEYVDAYCKKYPEKGSISVDEALTHKIVINVAVHYIERGNL